MTPSTTLKSLLAVASVALAGAAFAQVQPPNEQKGTSAAATPAVTQNAQTPPPANNAATGASGSTGTTMNSGASGSSGSTMNSGATSGNMSGATTGRRAARADRN